MREVHKKAILIKTVKGKKDQVRKIVESWTAQEKVYVTELNKTSFYFYDWKVWCEGIKRDLEKLYPELINEIIYPYEPRPGRQRRVPRSVRPDSNYCQVCTGRCEYVMFQNEIWNIISKNNKYEFVCLSCAETKLKRKLTLEDFMDIEMNNDFKSGWLFGAKNG